MIESSESTRNQKTLQLWLAAFFIVAVFALGVVFRVAAMSEPLWLDELHSSWVISGSLADVFERARIGNQGPLFFYAEYLSVSLMGHVEFALRLPSLLASIALLVSIPWIVFRLSGCLLGAGLAMLLAAIDDNFLFYSVEARPYAMVQLVAVWQIFFFIECVVRDRVGATGLAAWLTLTPVLFYLHFTTISLLAAQLLLVGGLAVWHLVINDEQRRKRFLTLLLAFVAPLLVMSTGIRMLMEVGQHRSDWSLMVSPNRYGLMLIAHFVVYLLPAATLAFVRRRGGFERTSLGLIFVSGWLVGLPLAFSYIASTMEVAPLAHYRFSIASSTFLIVLSGTMLCLIASVRGRLVAVILTLVLAVTTNPLLFPALSNGSFPSQRHENWRDASLAWMGGPILLCSNLVEDARETEGESEDFKTYLKFPLLGIYSTMSEGNVIACSLKGGRVFVPREIRERIAKEDSFQLLIRMWPEDAQAVADSLHAELAGDWSVKRQIEVAGALNLFQFSK